MKKLPFYYFVTKDGGSAYRAPVRISKRQKVLGQFSVVKPPHVFTPTGWSSSNRFAGPEGIESFHANLEAGEVVRCPMLAACTKINADVVLFAPTLSSRIASKDQTQK